MAVCAMEAERVWELIGEEFVDMDRLRQRTGERYVDWDAENGALPATLEGRFTADELEAIAWFMRHAKPGHFMDWRTGEPCKLA